MKQFKLMALLLAVTLMVSLVSKSQQISLSESSSNDTLRIQLGSYKFIKVADKVFKIKTTLEEVKEEPQYDSVLIGDFKWLNDSPIHYIDTLHFGSSLGSMIDLKSIITYPIDTMPILAYIIDTTSFGMQYVDSLMLRVSPKSSRKKTKSKKKASGVTSFRSSYGKLEHHNYINY